MNLETTMRALADQTRLRIMRLLGTMELAVGELAQVLGQSQPRVSRHVAILCDAELAERRREGSWVFLRTRLADEASGELGCAVAAILTAAETDDEQFRRQCEQDRQHLAAIRQAREAGAADWFASHAEEWDDLRSLHTPDAAVESALVEALGDEPLGTLLDIGTGTGRMAELFGTGADHVVALDKSLEMLRVARAKLQHLPADRIELVQGDFYGLPFDDDRFHTVLLHQVLHYAPEPERALAEAARVLKDGGRIAIVDFAAHTHEELRERFQHVRLGFSDSQMRELLRHAGFVPSQAVTLEGSQLEVKVWIGRQFSRSPAKRSKEAAR
ncbi:MAG: metalloregulator ArsR/SmtB family transcription factor [Erythrobacter sp.]|nr:metalloregulator ArsR/SmtB family transcription factor [Erythrobacter sp.]